MTVAEKIEMYKGKKAFIKDVSKVFEAGHKGSSVASVDYEVYIKDIELGDENRTYFEEYVIVNYSGGSYAVKRVSGNSNTANFRAVGYLLDGGYYDENYTYDSLTTIGYELVELD